MPPAPRAWPRQDGAGAASARSSRSPSGPPSRVGARPPSARVRPPSRPPLCGWTTGRHRAEAPRAARATAPEARGAARSARLHCAGAGRPTPQDLSRCSGPVAARSSVARSSSPPRHPRSCDPAPKARSPESVASRSDPGPTGTPLPDPPRSDEQQPAPWFASATHGPPAYPLRNSPGILNPSPSPGNRMIRTLSYIRGGAVQLVDLIPEAEAVLALEPDELGLHMLPVLAHWPSYDRLELRNFLAAVGHYPAVYH